MSGISLRSNTLLLCLSFAGVLGATGVGCSSSSDDAAGSEAGKSSAGAPGHAGAPSSDVAGDSSVPEGGEPGVGEGGARDLPAAGSGSAGRASSSGGTGGNEGTAAGSAGSDAGAAPIEAAGASSDAGAAGTSSVEDPDAEAKARALALIDSLPAVQRCTTCHQSNYAGLGFYPNLTPDETNGIGSWTDAEIKTAIHDGKGKGGVTLCSTMERYPFSTQQLDDLVVYLRSLPPNSKKITAKCP